MNTIKKQLKLKIVFIGDSGVGKTSLLNRYFYDSFNPNRRLLDLYQRELNIRNRVVQIEVWDTVGQERYEAMQSTFYRNADACVLVYDVTRPATLDNLVRWREQFLKYADQNQNGHSAKVPIAVLANNINMAHRSLMKFHHQRTEKLLQDVICFDANSEDGSNLDEVFHELATLALDKKLENNRLRYRSRVELTVLPNTTLANKCLC